MNVYLARKLAIVSLVVISAALSSSLAPQSRGQEKKAKGRLPAYYGDLVSDAQKQQIYGVQEKYAKQIADLQAQLDAVAKQRDSEIEGILNADQKEKVKKAQEEAAAKKKKAAADKKASADKAK
jgi:hypothetical protein